MKKFLQGIDIKKLMVSILIAEGIGVLSAFFTKDTMEIYKSLNQPAFAPPGWIFGPVWLILYLLMGIAAYIVWAKASNSSKGKSALMFYSIQLAFNFFWSILFFRLQMRGLALFELIILLIAIIFTTSKFYKIDKTAGYLMIPYILWVSFASILNYTVWILNK